jgi:hypothetical protein
MDAKRFDTLARVWSTRRSRRTAMRLVGVPALGSVLGLLRMGSAGAWEKPGLCLPNGSRCDPKAVPNGCCSGKCSRKRMRCKAAPDQGTCTIEEDTCGPGSSHPCDAAGTGSCTCHVTTRGFSFCGDIFRAGTCVNCTSDRDCEQRPGVGQRGDRCVQCQTACPETNGGMCLHKCPDPATP